VTASLTTWARLLAGVGNMDLRRVGRTAGGRVNGRTCLYEVLERVLNPERSKIIANQRRWPRLIDLASMNPRDEFRNAREGS
jgi:hypothetical protein